MMRIYELEKDEMPKEKLQHLILESIRPLRFFNNRGYFFIIDKKGKRLMHAAYPRLEGEIGINYRDANGKYAMREALQIVKERGEGFSSWTFAHPTQKDQQFLKIGYHKEFAPYDWVIGTGEYIGNVRKDLQTQLIEWVNAYYKDELTGYFILDNSKKALVCKNIEQNERCFITPDGKSLSYKDVNQFTPKQRTIEYVSPISKKIQRLTYVTVLPEWQWVIGATINLDRYKAELERKSNLIIQNNEDSLKKLYIITLCLCLFFAIFSHFMGNKLLARFINYNKEINHAFDEKLSAQDKLNYSLQYSPLTNLMRKGAFAEYVTPIYEESIQQRHLFAILCINIDNFNIINERYGHLFADRLLTLLGQRFLTLIDKLQYLHVGHFSGDKFICSISHIDSTHQVKNYIDAIKEDILAPINLDGELLTISITTGVASSRDGADSIEDLITKATLIQFRAHLKDKGSIIFYNDRLEAIVAREHEIEKQLYPAILNDAIKVVYQPQISCIDESLANVEALARWNSKTLGFISPMEFFHIAERSGLIHKLGLYIFKKACEGILSFSTNKDGTPVSVSINISPRQLYHSEFKNRIISIANEVGIDIERITLEVTENVLIEDIKTVMPLLNSLRECGFGLSLDDFGTGYSSLRYLNSLPITELKIDKSFVDNILSDSQTQMLVRSILAIGNFSHITVVAEGVETQEQAQWIKAHNCDYIQGFFYSKPLPINELEKKYLQAL